MRGAQSISSLRHRGGALRWVRLALPAFAVALCAPSENVSAQGVFDFLFGGALRPSGRPPEPPSPAPQSVRPQADPGADPLGNVSAGRSIANSNTGRGVSYCARLCDGRYFPIEHHASVTPAKLCSALCPASPTKVFSGSVIEFAVAADGGRYADLKNAYLYRKRVVADCTCNGKDSFGLAAIDVAADPTLQSGDTVATAEGAAKFDAARPAPRPAAGAVPASPDPNRGPVFRSAPVAPMRPN